MKTSEHLEHTTLYRADDTTATKELLKTFSVYFSLLTALAFFSGDYVAMEIKYFLAPFLVLLLGLSLTRVFISAHDMAHMNYFRSLELNRFVGIATGTVAHMNFFRWQRMHNEHHTESGNISGDFNSLVKVKKSDYDSLRPWQKMVFRVATYPLITYLVIMPLLLATPFLFWIMDLVVYKKLRFPVFYDLVVISIWTVVFTFGNSYFITVYVCQAALGACIGGLLFNAQHSYPDSYTQVADKWDFIKAGTQGSSRFLIPRWLRFFTQSIEVHDIHHVDPSVPSYKLYACAQARPDLWLEAKRINLRGILECTKYRIYNDETGRYDTIPE